MENFKKRREAILDTFERSKAELQQLNLDIEDRIAECNAHISGLREEVKGLESLKSSNNTSISAFAKFLK